MESDNKEDNAIYKVLVDNRKLKYSLWPVDVENPAGWTDTGVSGHRGECFNYIKEMVMLWPL